MSQLARKIRTQCRTAGWLLLGAIVAASVLPMVFRPLSGLAPGVERAIAFLALGFLFGVGYFRNWMLVLCVLTVGAFAIETLQLLTPDRHATLLDALLKASGSAIGAFAGRLVINRGLL
ncbi:VanZ family protein [Mesorhizobium sp. WSM2239]|uniref:VanZ family protein n=2 Tax=unclassified Mesorhizobium TaxID=325217 RepID=A0AAU8DGU4_9HYPH